MTDPRGQDEPGHEQARPYGQLVASTGLSSSHLLMLEAVPSGARVLDIGCATGYLAAELVRRGCTVVGFEQDRASAEQARAHCDQVIVGDIEREEDRASLPATQDAVLFGDVLEHLRDPLAVLRWAQTRLAPNARVVISLPNIGVWFARQAVARGKFPYADSGIFDRTHLRFFTRDSAHELATQTGYAIDCERFTPTVLPFELAAHAILGTPFEWDTNATNRLRRAAAQRWPTMFALQFVLTLKPAALTVGGAEPVA